MQAQIDYSPATIQAAMLFIKQLEAELKPLTIHERDVWIARELSPHHNIPAPVKRIRPDFETFKKIRHANEK